MDEILLEDRSGISGRFVVVIEEGGHSVWVYLTERASSRPVRDVPLASRVDPLPLHRTHEYTASGGPPPVGEGFLAPGWKRVGPLGTFMARWSADGESVCILIDGVPSAILSASTGHGASRALLKDGPWGRRWDDREYERLFGRD